MAAFDLDANLGQFNGHRNHSMLLVGDDGLRHNNRY